MVTTSFPIVGDGSEAAGSFVSDLAEEVALHVPIRVVAPSRKSAREVLTENLEVFRYAAPDQPLSTLRPWKPADLAEIIRVLDSGARATSDAVHAGPAAHIFALWALPSGEWARRASIETGVPYSVWTLGSDIWTLGRVPLVRSAMRRVLRHAHTCFSDGLKLADDTRRIAGRDVEFLPSTRRIGSREVRLLRNKPPYRLLFLGRWHPNKGIDLLLDALDLLDADDWSRISVVQILGGGPLDLLVRGRAENLRAKGRSVVVGGFVAKPEAESAIGNADWVLIPSRIESIPVVFSDAMKLGRPVICNPVGDLQRLTSEHSVGVCSSSVSAADFVSAIRTATQSDACSHAIAITSAASMFSLDNSVVPKVLGLSERSNLPEGT